MTRSAWCAPLGSGADPVLTNAVLQIGDDANQDVGLTVAALGFRRFLVQTGKYRPGDEDKLEEKPEWVGRDFAAAVDAILAEAA